MVLTPALTENPYSEPASSMTVEQRQFLTMRGVATPEDLKHPADRLAFFDLRAISLPFDRSAKHAVDLDPGKLARLGPVERMEVFELAQVLKKMRVEADEGKARSTTEAEVSLALERVRPFT